MLYNLITLPADSISKGMEKHVGMPANFLERLFSSFVLLGTLEATVGTTLGPQEPRDLQGGCPKAIHGEGL